MIILVILSIFTVILSSYLWVKQRHLYWANRRIPYLKPPSLLYGNDYDLIAGKLSLSESAAKHYNDLAPHRFGGIFHLYKPLLYVRDPELIKQILIKDFRHFRDHLSDLAIKEEPLTLLLFNLTGDEWKALRQKLTPLYSSGKMKIMFELMKNSAEGMKRVVDRSAHDRAAVDAKDLMTRYATDIVCSCAFGFDIDSQNNKNLEFLSKIKQLLNPSRKRRRLREALFSLSPALVRFLRFKLFPQEMTDFLVNFVKDTIEYRRKNGIVRNDFLNLLMKLQEEESEEIKKVGLDFNIELLAAQCFTFFNAGTRPTSTSLSFILYELAEHPDVQKKLQEEVDYVLGKNGGQITYESLREMHYMHKVFNETSRLYPVSRVIRICTEDYHIPDSDCVIKKGESIFISPYGLHRDPQYYPDPDVFNPENFSEEAKIRRPACAFLPFGDGPRNCIAKQFAIVQIELGLATIMKDYTVGVSPEMKLPIEYLPHVLLTDSKNEILLTFNKRVIDQS